MVDGAVKFVVVEERRSDLVPAVKRPSRPEEKYKESFHGHSEVVVVRLMGLSEVEGDD